MSSEEQSPVHCLELLVETTEVLISFLTDQDDDKSYEAATILLTQTFDLFGPTSITMEQFFPVLDVIEKRISASDLAGALGQAKLFRKQLHEIIDLVRQGS
jgi:hypothetical protein